MSCQVPTTVDREEQLTGFGIQPTSGFPVAASEAESPDPGFPVVAS
jgi:hypothetical protein